jgi:hypothetical protein
MPNPGDIYYALDTNKTYVVVNGQWVLQSPEFTGDINIPQATTVATLTTVNAAPGTYGDANNVPTITVDAKGRVTQAFNTPINVPAPTASGPNDSVQYNSGGFFAGDAAFTYEPTTATLTFNNGQINGALAFTTPITTFNNLSPLTTKGDLLAHDSYTNLRLPVGSNGQVLVANSTAAAGLAWTTVAFGGGTNVPYYVATATTYILPEYYQANFIIEIEVDGDLEIDGYLIELANQ